MPKDRRARHRVTTAALTAGVLLMTVGCSSSGYPTVTTDADKPFVLSGVENVTEIAQLTGPDAMNDTESVGVAGTDLGSMVTVGDRTYLIFGDTFGERDPNSIGGQGGFWRSNVAVWTSDDDPSDGLTFDAWAPTDEYGLAAALVEGDHAANTGAGEVTKIPTQGFAVDETMYIQFMSVSFWGEPGAWDANYAGLAKSTDLGETWEVIENVTWPGDSNFVQLAAANVDDGGDYLYLWGIPSGRFGGVQLMRVPLAVESIEDPAAYTYFAGTREDDSPIWSAELADAEEILPPTVGELSVIWSTYLDRWLMTYSDGGSAFVREGVTPWGPWGDPIEMISAADYPGLYSPYMNPRYVSDDGRTIYFTLSLWGPYNVFWFSMDLVRTNE